jgi:transposase
MRPATVLWEVFVRRFEEAFEQYHRRSLTGEKAEELLGRSGRKFRRLCVRYEEEGVEGLRDRRIGRASPRRAPEGELARMQELYRERYSDFTVKHFHEQLVRRHNYWLSYTQPASGPHPQGGEGGQSAGSGAHQVPGGSVRQLRNASAHGDEAPPVRGAMW